jgi:thiamine pyrophosphate-dependent acetolactate synthase large subunit-like protein
MAKTLPTTTTGAAALVRTLGELGVELLFGLPGVHNLSVWRALAESQIRLVGVRHEQTAVYAADGYARATGRLGVALVTTGPGAANTLGATGEAMASSSPVLVIATDIPSGLRREGVYRGVLHETRDQTAMFRPVTKAAQLVARPEEIPGAVAQSARVAQAASSGPVYLGIPTDLLSAPVPSGRALAPSEEPGASVPETSEAAGASVPETSEAPGASVPGTAISRACELLAGARRPLIWAGGGALRAEAGPVLDQLARKLAAPVLTTYMGRGVLPVDHPCLVPGPVHAREIGALWDEADVVLAVGTDFDGMMTQNWLMPAPPALISVNLSEAEASKSYPSTVALIGDARAVLTQLLPRLSPRPGLPELERRLIGLGEAVSASVAADDPQAAEFLEIMGRALPADAVVVADMCIPGYWLAGYRQVPAPRKLAYPMGWGTLGFGFPASLGAALAGAGPAVCVTGDGGFLFACGELATVAQDEIPVTIVLVDDRGYGMLRFDQARAGDEPFGVDLVAPDFEALAHSFGIAASTIDGFGPAFEAALRDSVAATEPRVIVVQAALSPPPTTSPRWYRRN